MATTIDSVSVTLVERMEFAGGQTVTFDLPPDHWLVAALREYHERKLQAEELAAEPSVLFGRRVP